MRKKLNDESGLTLVEVLAATMIMVLLTLVLNTGMQMAMDTYENMVAKNELELLLSTAVDALTDELRYARDVYGTGPDFTYTSDSYGHETKLNFSAAGENAGQLMAKSKEISELVDADGNELYSDGYRVLSTGAYGSNNPYKDYKLTGTIEYDDGVFTVKNLTAATKDDSGKPVSATAPEMIIRCLNPAAADGT